MRVVISWSFTRVVLVHVTGMLNQQKKIAVSITKASALLNKSVTPSSSVPVICHAAVTPLLPCVKLSWNFPFARFD